jgi:hypothetical protein
MGDLLGDLNHLLEVERAEVEALIDLTRMSADVLEREMLQQIGGDAAWACTSLRGQIEALGGIPSRRVAPLLAQMRARDHFAARLRLFAQHQQAVLESVNTLLENQQLPPAVRELLTELYQVHLPTLAWCDQRAAAFGAREVSQESNSFERATERRAAGEGREAPHRGRNKRSAGETSKGSEADHAEPPRFG